MLGIPHFKLIFNENNSRGRTVTFYYSHGYGGGSRTQGGNLTKFAKATTAFEADCYLFGHVHQLQYDSFPYLGVHGTKIDKNFLFDARSIGMLFLPVK